MFVQVYVVQLSSELGEARGCWGGEGGGAGTCLSKLGGAKQACPCLSDKLVYACLTSLNKLV